MLKISTHNYKLKEKIMEKFKKIFKDKKIENLVSFLIILVITLIIINNIIKEDDDKKQTNYSGAELASAIPIENYNDDLEKRLENILSKIEGVGEVSVLITYSESSQIVPIYNENTSKSITEEQDTSGGSRKVQSEDNEKTVVTDSSSNPITGKTITPKIEGAIVTAKGAGNTNVKSNIVSAIEAVTGLPTHKIQVFEKSSN